MTRDLDAVRRNFADMNTGALLEDFALHPGEYEPESLKLLRLELTARGYSPEDLNKAVTETVRNHLPDLANAELIGLLIHLKPHAGPEVLGLIRRELLQRGLTPENLAASAGENLSEEPPDIGALVPTAEFESIMLAQQAQDVLRQHGIESYLRGQESGAWGFDALYMVQNGIAVYVLAGEEEVAREVLEEFTPVAEEREGVKLETPPSEELEE